MVAAILVAGRAHGDIQARGLLARMLAAGTVAAFALDVGEVLQVRGHRRIVANLQHRRERPAERLLDIVEVRRSPPAGTCCSPECGRRSSSRCNARREDHRLRAGPSSRATFGSTACNGRPNRLADWCRGTRRRWPRQRRSRLSPSRTRSWSPRPGRRPRAATHNRLPYPVAAKACASLDSPEPLSNPSALPRHSNCKWKRREPDSLRRR